MQYSAACNKNITGGTEYNIIFSIRNLFPISRLYCVCHHAAYRRIRNRILVDRL